MKLLTMNDYLQIKCYCLLIVALLLNQAKAQDNFVTKGGNYIKLNVKSEFGVTDNFLFDDEGKDTTYFELAPSLNMQTQFERQLIKFHTKINHFKYSDFSQDNHSNIAISPSYQFKFTENKALSIESLYLSRYESRGTGLSLGDGDSLNKGDTKETINYSIGYLYGTQDSVAKFQVNIGGSKNQFNTRRELTHTQDQSSQFYKITLDYLLSGQSYLATEFKMESTSFAKNSTQDKDKYVALIGIKWQTTAISQFAALFGYQEVKFSEAVFEDDSAFKWRIDYLWHPIESTRVLIGSERDFEEANRLSNSYRIVDNYNIRVTTSFSEYFGVSATVGMKQEDIIFQNSVNNENYVFGEIQLNYQRNEWLSWFLKFNYNDFNSTNNELDYQKNSFSLGFNVNI